MLGVAADRVVLGVQPVSPLLSPLVHLLRLRHPATMVQLEPFPKLVAFDLDYTLWDL